MKNRKKERNLHIHIGILKFEKINMYISPPFSRNFKYNGSIRKTETLTQIDYSANFRIEIMTIIYFFTFC